MDQRPDVDALFTAFVRSYGGEIVEDLVGKNPGFRNADFLFRDAGIVGELKRLSVDGSADAVLQRKLNTKYQEWIKQGRVPYAAGRRRVDSNTLPVDCQHELMRLVETPIRTHLVSANRQIKQTKSALGIPNAKGIVFLVNDGNYGFETNVALHLMGRVLGSKFTSINSLVYFTVNMVSHTPDAQGPILVWVHGARPERLPAVEYHFVDDLHAAWRRYLGKAVGRNIGVVPLTCRDEVDRISLDRTRPNPWPRAQ